MLEYFKNPLLCKDNVTHFNLELIKAVGDCLNSSLEFLDQTEVKGSPVIGGNLPALGGVRVNAANRLVGPAYGEDVSGINTHSPILSAQINYIHVTVILKATFPFHMANIPLMASGKNMMHYLNGISK